MAIQIKIQEATGSDSRTTTKIDLLSEIQAPEEIRSKIKRDVGDYLIEQITLKAAASKSVVSGESWEKLSKEYKAKKVAEGGPGKPTMELHGDLLDALTYKETPDGIEVGWYGSEAAKADGHNNFSGRSQIPTRRTLPGEGQDFIPSVEREVQKIIADHLAEANLPDAEDFDSVNTKADLYDVLEEYFPGMSIPEMRLSVSRNSDWVEFLRDEDLLGYL